MQYYYHKTKNFIFTIPMEEGSPPPTESSEEGLVPKPKTYRITPVQQAAASCTGAVITSLFVTPLDVIKTRLQAQQKGTVKTKCYLYCNGLMEHICECNPKYATLTTQTKIVHFNGTLDAFVKISKYEGITSLWSGLSPTLVLALPATILYFVTYEQLQLRLRERYHNNVANFDVAPPLWIPMISGATARILAVTCVSPLELIRTKMQSERLSYLGIAKAVKMLVKTCGIAGLWKGVVSTLLRDVPFSAIYWTSYETIKKCLGSSGHEPPSFSVSFTAGAISGAAAATVTTPFDVVKTHQQIEFGEKTIYASEPTPHINNIRSTMRRIVSQHGIQGLYAGLLPRLMKVAPACAIMISSFEYGKKFFSKVSSDESEPPLVLTHREISVVPSYKDFDFEDIKKSDCDMS